MAWNVQAEAAAALGPPPPPPSRSSKVAGSHPASPPTSLQTPRLSPARPCSLPLAAHPPPITPPRPGRAIAPRVLRAAVHPPLRSVHMPQIPLFARQDQLAAPSTRRLSVGDDHREPSPQMLMRRAIIPGCHSRKH